MKMNKAFLFLLFILFLAVCPACAGLMQNTESEPKNLSGMSVFLEGQEISALYDDGKYLWVGGKSGIVLLDRSTGELHKKLDAEIEMVYASGIEKSADGLIWAGHSGGVTAFSPEGAELFSISEPQIPGGRVNALLADGKGLWIGAMEGAAYLEKNGESWQVKEILTSENGLSDDCVNVLFKNEDEIWFGTYLAAGKGGCSIRDRDGNWKHLSVDEGLPHRYVNAILPVLKQEILIAAGHLNHGGMARAYRQEDGGWQITKTWNREDKIPGDKVRWLFLDSAGRLWITTESNGILLCQSVDSLQSPIENALVLTTQSGLSDNEVKVIAECDDCIWLGSRMGLTRVEKSEIDQWFQIYLQGGNNNG